MTSISVDDHFLSSSSGDPPDLPPFPTRRSSDLRHRGGPSQGDGRRNLGYATRRVWRVSRKYCLDDRLVRVGPHPDRKSTRLNSSHSQISYAVFCLKKKKRRTHCLKGASRTSCS